MKSRNNKKILVAILDNLGDTVMATAIVRPLKQLFPGSEIGFWVKRYAAPLFDGHLMIHRVHASDPFWDVSPGHPAGSKADFNAAMKEIKSVQYDAVLILNAEWRRAMACWWMGIPERVGYKRRKSSFFLTAGVNGPAGNQHFADDHRILLEEWTGTTVPKELCRSVLDVSASEKAWLANWQSSQGSKFKSYVVFHPFAGDPLKCWPLEKWMRLSEDLIHENFPHQIVWMAGPNEENVLKQGLTAEISSASIFLKGATVGQSKAVLSEAEIFVGGDSGPSHIASSVGTPVVALFGPTNPARSGPVGGGPVRILKRNPTSGLEIEDVKGALMESLKEAV